MLVVIAINLNQLSKKVQS